MKLLAIFLFALTIRIVHIETYPTQTSWSDTEQSAFNILSGKGLLYPAEPSPIKNLPSSYRAFRPPMYSLFIAAVYLLGKSRRTLFYAQAVMDSATAVGLTLLAGPIAGLLYSVYLESIWNISIIVPWFLCGFLLTAVLVCKNPIGSGLLFGALVLTRAEFVMALPWMIWRNS